MAMKRRLSDEEKLDFIREVFKNKKCDICFDKGGRGGSDQGFVQGKSKAIFFLPQQRVV